MISSNLSKFILSAYHSVPLISLPTFVCLLWSFFPLCLADAPLRGAARCQKAVSTFILLYHSMCFTGRQPGKPWLRKLLARSFWVVGFVARRGHSPGLTVIQEEARKHLGLCISWSLLPRQAFIGAVKPPAFQNQSGAAKIAGHWAHPVTFAEVMLLPGCVLFSLHQPLQQAIETSWLAQKLAGRSSCTVMRELRKTGSLPAPSMTCPW